MFSKHQMEGCFTAFIYPIWKCIWDVKGAHPWKGDYFLKSNFIKESYNTWYSYMIYSLKHIALMAREHPGYKLWFLRPEKCLSLIV